jgi:rhomboid-related protein 1/2/3
MNLILQIIIGVPLEWVHKWRVIPIYIGGIIAGSLGQSVCDTGVALVGASGGVYALIGAHFGNIFMNWTEMVNGWDDYPPLGFICSPFFKIPLFLVLVIGDTGIAVIRRWWPSFAGGAGASPVGIGAHLGGLVAGFLLSVAFVKNFKEEPWEKWPFYIVLVIYLLLTLFAVLWNTFYPNYPTTDWNPCCHVCT